MPRRLISIFAGVAALPLIALALSACGGGGAATAAPAPPKTSSGTSATVGVAKTRLGNVLINSQSRTLYLFKADSATTSACSGACAAAWPPLLATSNPNASQGLTASKLGTITRADGTRQVAYNGHPLYLFSKDQKPGDTNGQGVTAFGAAWFALTPAGSQFSASPPGSTGGGSSSGGSSGGGSVY